MEQTKVIWAPQAGPQHALVKCPLKEVFFGGSRGGGKTDGVLGKWAIKELRYGEDFNAIMFRKTTVSSVDAIERSKQIYGPLGGKFNEQSRVWRMPNGGRIQFAYLDSVTDAQEYQGRNLTDVWIEEAGQYVSPDPIWRLFGALRSALGVPTQLILTANPGGPGQHWIRDRYDLVPFPLKPRILDRRLPDGSLHQVAVIPSRIADNKILLNADPTYISNLHMVGSPALVRAWLEGDWAAIEGAFFPEFDPARHIIRPFIVPEHWLRFRSMDWGSASPFSVGWWAVAGDDHILFDKTIPRGSIIRYREWYGASAPNKGLKLTAEQVAEGIVVREIEGEDITYGVLDPAAFAQDGGPSIAERLFTGGVNFRRADNKRLARFGALGGWDQVRSRLVGDSNGRALIYFFDICGAAIRTLPALQHDLDKPEDVDTDSEDHAPDEIRYACMSRPWVPEAEKEKPGLKLLQDCTLDDLWEIQTPTRKGRIYA